MRIHIRILPAEVRMMPCRTRPSTLLTTTFRCSSVPRSCPVATSRQPSPAPCGVSSNSRRANSRATRRSPSGWARAPADGTAQGWRKHFSSHQQYGSTAPTATLDVVDSLDDLRPLIPAELYDLVAMTADQSAIEDLDI